jgi:hypothetical protein
MTSHRPVRPSASLLTALAASTLRPPGWEGARSQRRWHHLSVARRERLWAIHLETLEAQPWEGEEQRAA